MPTQIFRLTAIILTFLGLAWKRSIPDIHVPTLLTVLIVILLWWELWTAAELPDNWTSLKQALSGLTRPSTLVPYTALLLLIHWGSTFFPTPSSPIPVYRTNTQLPTATAKPSNIPIRPGTLPTAPRPPATQPPPTSGLPATPRTPPVPQPIPAQQRSKSPATVEGPKPFPQAPTSNP
jgi:hypothetical protein